MDFSTLLADLPGVLAVHGPTDCLISNIVADSRQAGPGALFVAYRGVEVDGHRFLADAIRRGAAALVGELPPPADCPVPYVQVEDGRAALAWLVAAWHGHPSRSMALVGITGTDGKTTTANLLFSILRAAGRRAGLISTVNAIIGDQVYDTGLHTTTPDAPDVQRYLAQMRDAGTEIAVLEATSHGLAQHRVTGCAFDVAVVTNITHEHLDFHGSYEAYRDAKALLFRALTDPRLGAAQKPGISLLPKTAVLNRDDSSFAFLASIPAERVITYGVREGGGGDTEMRRLGDGVDRVIHLTAHDVRHSPAGTQFALQVSAALTSEPYDLSKSKTVTHPERSSGRPSTPLRSAQDAPAAQSKDASRAVTDFDRQNSLGPCVPASPFHLFTPLVGAFNVYNVLAAAGAALALGVEPEAIRAGVAAMKGVTGRMERVDRGQPFTAIVDFAHTPNALARALETARELVSPSGRVIAVFGSAGLRDRAKRRLMGEVAARLANFTAITAEDPRTEDLAAIMEETAAAMAGAGCLEDRHFVRIADRQRAILYAVQQARPGDVVIVCGKGHEQSMCFGTVEHPWRDQDALAWALDRLAGRGPETPPFVLPTWGQDLTSAA